MLPINREGTKWRHEHMPESQRSERLACGTVSILSGTDRDPRCSNFQGRKFLVISHPILGHSPDDPIIVERGPRSELRRSLDEWSLPSALLPILRIVFSLAGVDIPTDLHILIVRGSPTAVF